MITRQQTRLIAIDEAQSVVPKSGGDDKSANIKLLRELIDDLHIPIIFTGKEDVLTILAADDAVRSRVRCKLYLNYFSCKTTDDSLDFADYIEGLLDFFPRKMHGFKFLNETPDGEITLSSNINNLVRIVLATDGCPRSIKFLLRSVLETTTSDDVVTTEHFKKAFLMADNLEKPLQFNPFDATLDRVKKEAEKRGLYDSNEY
ncbi:TniB family NTP-binding protein [Vibrio parahaemolyticus]|uniref:TniB family NTP-binding protein n=1 Tax=Vibrio parahaemolyticus TaxID=670 RepID=UPI0038919E20